MGPRIAILAVFLGWPVQGCAAANPVNFMPYSSKEFNLLPHFLDLPPESSDDLLSIQPAGEVLRKHGMASHVGLVLNHRHFDLMSGEKLVAQHHQDSMMCEPVRNNTGALPYSFRISEDTSGGFQLHPMEFIDQPGEAFRAKYNAVVSNIEFIHEFAATLREHKILPKFGLTLLLRTDLLGNKTLETAAGPRKLMVNTPTDGEEVHNGKDMVIRQVIFRVPAVPGIIGHDGCSHDSCSHCGHGK